MNRHNLHAVILAAGLSNRMGASKPLLTAGNRPLLGQLYSHITAAGAAPIHIVLNAGVFGLLTARWPRDFPLARAVLNDAPEKGQMHSLRLGLAQAQSAGADAVIVALVDHPFVRLATLRAIISHSASSFGSIIIPVYAGRNGHPYLIPRACFGNFLGAPADATARDILHHLAQTTIRIGTDDPGVAANIDTPSDFASCQPANHDTSPRPFNIVFL
ncbi:MAG: nucleotidyltransferase family protein [Candidatus Sumerlaeota bacterium]|nr:nucleotidyltransferase family protein [Candidatus Sumerlaeota bacterium]